MTLQEAIEMIAAYLDNMAGEEDMASVLINNEGQCYLGVGVHDREQLTAEQLVDILVP